MEKRIAKEIVGGIVFWAIVIAFGYAFLKYTPDQLSGESDFGNVEMKGE